jgi:6-phosphogluconolactonase
MPEIIVKPDPSAVARAAAERIVAQASAAIADRGKFSVALAGGSTPGATYALLASDKFAARVDWPRVHVFWGDERCVPPHDPGSNYRMADEALLSNVPIPANNLHRVRGELEPQAAAESYAAELRAFFGAPWPRFDLVLLGMGNDGHTASLFPGSAALQETEQPVVAVTAHYQDRPACRVTLTPRAINGSRQVLFLVSGGAKAGTLQAVLEGPGGRHPAQHIRPRAGQLTWLLDAAAASQLKRPTQ